MSYRGGRGNFRGRGRGRGGYGGNRYNDEPPDYVVELGKVMHPCQEDLVCHCTNEKVCKKSYILLNIPVTKIKLNFAF